MTAAQPSLRERLKSLSLRRKLTLTQQVISVGVVLFTGVALFGHQAYALRAQFRVEIEALTQMIANYAVGPVSFEDQRGMAEVLSVLSARPEIDYAALRGSDGTVLADYGTARTAASAGEVVFDGWILSCREPLDLQGETIGSLSLHANFRPLLLEALGSFLPVLLGMAVATLLGVMVITRFSVQVLLRGLQGLTGSATRIAATSDYSVRATVMAHDEVGQLTDTFNRMLDRLQSTNHELRTTNESLATEITERKRLERALVTSSRLAGMAEVATGVLHNVGNVLNSVNVSAHLLRDRLEASKLNSLHRTVDLIRPHLEQPARFFSHDPRGQLVPRFIVELAVQLEQEHTDLREELRSLANNIEHIKEIVSTQQSYSRTAGVNERLDPVELIEDAIRINQPSMDRHGIQLERDFEEGIEFLADRHRMLQILVNLISNAVHAAKPPEVTDRRIEVSLGNGEGQLHIAVRDHGIGIDHENLTRIFQHGFTTREDGHGFGLHSGSLAARAMGGALEVSSDGLGRGACFLLTVPLEPPEKSAVTSESAAPFSL